MVLSRKPLYFPLPPIILSNNPLPYSYTYKFLGLLIDNKLNWKSHISTIRSKLASVCGIIYRIRNRIVQSISKMLYFSLAYPHIVYCSIIWSSAYDSNLQCLRVSQKKLIRMIMKKPRNEHTTPLFRQLKILKLDDILKMCSLQFVYKTLNHIVYSPINFTIREIGAYNIRNPQPLVVPFCRTHHSSRFIHVRGANLWNELPDLIRNSISAYAFKRRLKKHYLYQYN